MGYEKSGRKPISHSRGLTEQTLAETAPKAARRLADFIDKKAKLSATTIDACKYVINQACGAPRLKIDQTVEGKITGTFVLVMPDGSRSTATDLKGDTPPPPTS